MSKYVLVSVSITDPQPHEIGFAVLDWESLQFTDSHVYTHEQFGSALKRRQELEDAALLNQHWPDARDPEVLALLADQTFQVAPDEKWNTYGPMARYQKACETVARKRLDSATADTH